MLVLSRKPEEKILIRFNDTEVIELTVVRISPNEVRLGFNASKSVTILRNELVEKAVAAAG